MAAWIFLGLAVATTAAAAGPVPEPLPAEQTPHQRALFAKHAAAAAAASAEATGEVLAFLDSSDFREALRRCCAELLPLSALELLKRYRAEARSAELAHALPAESLTAVWPDVTLAELEEHGWFLNEWQAGLLHGNATPGTPQAVNDLVQQRLYGCRPFTSPTAPTWAEAAGRLIYVAHNMRRLDYGSMPSFGDVVAVFNTTYVHDMVLTMPYDSGQYGMSCWHQGIPEGFAPPQLNCSSWGEVLGTLDHFDHLILPNLYMMGNWSLGNFSFRYNMSANVQSLFGRSAIAKLPYEAIPPVDTFEAVQYLETNILGNPRLPAGVSFLIGNGGTLFGTALGRQLQRVAAARGWPLFWAMTGLPSPQTQANFTLPLLPSNRRFADPASHRALTDAPLAENAEKGFEEVWAQAKELRENRNLTEADSEGWWQQLTATQLMVAPVTHGRCASHCVAQLSVGCVCRVAKVEVMLV
ncbi:unnamed protein product [Effrenium voratum]|uniref:Uncharacterized protein n=1 Tax=Effrenium voratum TaxID=2562239 RepID=A0AA36JI48_9DINO|nr:unnamed protein product [Effrenium voratum]CAJ1425598.1 unnamed protein product [Effrenium voratum]